MGQQLRIRSTFIFALVVLGLIPMAGFAWHSYDRAVTREFKEVNDHHLLLARNLSSSLSRYERDVRASIASIAESLSHDAEHPDSIQLLTVLGIQSVDIIEPKTNAQLKSVSIDNLWASYPIDPAVIDLSQSLTNQASFTFLPVAKTIHGNIIHVIGKQDGLAVVARINTDYFIELASQISFGVKGHAAIVDQNGNTLAHPDSAWVNSAKNIAKVSSVQRMMNGETGVEQFYSPAMKGNMIAGLTTVSGTGWGVMIPQPVSEIYAKVFENLTPIFVGLAMAFFSALAMIYFSIRWFARPLENFTADLKKQAKAGMPAEVPPMRYSTRIQELQSIFAAYNNLAKIVQGNTTEMTKRAIEDSVTGIGNRTYFEQGAKSQIESRIALSKSGVLIFLDLDGFKEINDTRGHAVGDAFLNQFAQRLYPATKALMDREFRGAPGAHPIIGRIGGDEFAILLPTPDNHCDIAKFCEELRQSFPEFIEIDGNQIPCGVSAGGALYPEQGTVVADLVRKADVALYTAKLHGKGQFQLYNKLNALGGKSEILTAMVKAIAQDELVLEYQPKFCLTKQRITGVEALLRWNHPEHGMIPPNLFLPAIQQTYVMASLGEWVIGRALSDQNLLDQLGHELDIAINIGTEHFTAPGFEANLVKQCAEAGADPRRLQIEITEDVQDKADDTASEIVKSIQSHGFTVAVDDFGKGFSNLSRLASMSVDVVKLDRSLICDPDLQIILKSAINMAHGLGSRVVVEGVETLDEVSRAERAGADALQGFYFTKSLAPYALVDWLEMRNSNPQHSQVLQLQKFLASA